MTQPMGHYDGVLGVFW